MLKFSLEEKQKICEIIKSFTITEKGDTLKSITKENRAKALLFFEKNLSQKEIAKIYNVTPTAIRDTLMRVTRKAKRFLKEEN